MSGLARRAAHLNCSTSITIEDVGGVGAIG
jgi:hypothetical protein